MCTALPNTRGLSWGWLRSWVSSLRLAALNSHSCCFLEMRRKRHFRMLQGEKEDRARARSHSSPHSACAALGLRAGLPCPPGLASARQRRGVRRRPERGCPRRKPAEEACAGDASRGPGAPLGPQPQEACPPRAPGASDFPRTWVGTQNMPWVLGPLSPCKGRCPHLARQQSGWEEGRRGRGQLRGETGRGSL